MTTTQQLIADYNAYKFYETLEIQTRTGDATYSGTWIDVTSYLNDSDPVITKKLDFDNFGFGEFFSGSLDLTLDNRQSKFSDIDDIYSLFYDTYSRNYAKIRYKAGYYDTDGTTKINEVVFNGLINEDDFETNLQTGEIPLTAIDYAGYLQYVNIPDATFTGSDTYKNVVSDLMALGNISLFITHSAGNINPDFNLTFDDTSQFNNRTVFEVLTDITTKANSVWYIDESDNIIVANRDTAAGTPFEFIGGYYSGSDTNIINIERVKNRFNIINSCKFENSTLSEVDSATAAELSKNGVHIFELGGDDITNATTANSICQIIRTDTQTPKDKEIVTTVYMPNVLAFKDPVTISYQQAVQPSSKPLIWNADTNFNDGYFWNTLSIYSGITTDITYKYWGFEHTPRQGTTQHFLLEE